MSTLVPMTPGSGEFGSYNRNPTYFKFKANTFTWKWAIEAVSGVPAPTFFPTLRLLDESGQPLCEWVSATKNEWTFNIMRPNGYYVVASAEVQGGGLMGIRAKGFLVNSSGAPLLEAAPWTSQNRFEATSAASMGPGVAQLHYPPVITPFVMPLKARAAVPFNTRLTKAQLWCRNTGTHTHHSLNRIFAKTWEGDIVEELTTKYFYSQLADAGKRPPSYALYDGPRGVGTVGFLNSILVNKAGTGYYFTDVHGRVGFKRLADGNVTTIAGWRTPEGQLKVHSQDQDTHKAQYDASFEFVGDTSKLIGAKTFAEPWVMIGHEDENGGRHEFLLADTRANVTGRIVFINHYAAHAHDNYDQPHHFAPVGYVPPPAPIGQSELVTWAEGEFVNRPFGLTEGPDGKVYWSNMEGPYSVCRANRDGSSKECVLQTATHFTEAMGGVFVPNAYSIYTAATLRGMVHGAMPVGGPMSSTFNIFHPQAIEFNSEGKLIIACRYTFVLLEADVVTKQVRRLVDLPQAGASSFGGFDVNMVIDTEGSFGPKDDIFTYGFHATLFRFDKTGKFISWPFFPEANGVGPDIPPGPLANTREPNYGWAIGIRAGRAIVEGSAAGWQEYEVTKRLPTDLTGPSGNWMTATELATHYSKLKAGYQAFHYGTNPPMALTHGPYGMGGQGIGLGYPNIYEMGTWSDAAVVAYVKGYGMNDAQAAAWLYCVRWRTQDIEYPVPDTTAPAAPTQLLEAMPQPFRLHGIAGTDPDIVEARVYANNGMTKIAVTPGQSFEVEITVPGPGLLTIEYSFVDKAGNESAKFSQMISA